MSLPGAFVILLAAGFAAVSGEAPGGMGALSTQSRGDCGVWTDLFQGIVDVCEFAKE